MKKSKVAVVACPDYEPAHIKESLQKGLEAIGGLEALTDQTNFSVSDLLINH